MIVPARAGSGRAAGIKDGGALGPGDAAYVEFLECCRGQSRDFRPVRWMMNPLSFHPWAENRVMGRLPGEPIQGERVE